MCGLSLFASGCLFKSARTPTRHFVLEPEPPSGQAPAAAQSRSVQIENVKMPSYLLQDSMVIRKSATEVEVFEKAIWAERLDDGFRRILDDDLSSRPAANQVPPSPTGRSGVAVGVSVAVRQFDVDTQGRGTLIASWQLTHAGSEKPVKSGVAHLTQTGPSPLGNPQVIATTLSALLDQFSQELAQAIRDSAGR